MRTDRWRVVAGGEHAQHVFHCESPTTDDRLAAEDPWITRDSLEQVQLVHSTETLRREARRATSASCIHS